MSRFSRRSLRARSRSGRIQVGRGQPETGRGAQKTGRGQPKTGRGQAGFTLPEMLIAAFLVASAAGLIATAIYQVFIVSQGGNARLSELTDLENAALWIGRDATESVSWTPGAGRVYGVFDTSDPTISYRYGFIGAENALARQVLVSGTPQQTLSIARHIANQGDVVFNVSGSLVTVAITSTSGATSQSATFNVSMRAR